VDDGSPKGEITPIEIPESELDVSKSETEVVDPDAGLVPPQVEKLADDSQPRKVEVEKKQTEPHQDKKGNTHAQGNIIIIKRIKKVVHGHHGGAWKIAYADFVTAMMTFFLLMWLLSMLNKYQKEGISDYFKRPVKDIIAQKTDPKNDMVKIQEVSTTNKNIQENKVNEAANIKDVKKAEQNKLASEQIKSELEKQLQSNPRISQYKNILNFKVTSQGLKIELKDLKDKPMFSSGKTNFADYASSIIEWLATEMNKYPNRVMIIGHTDSKPIHGSDEYTNWELSSDRSNATRRELVHFGMSPEKVVRIVGVADVDTLETAKSKEDDTNRRIDIVILNDDAFQKMQDE
jgi:chemotaxis protein MotB